MPTPDLTGYRVVHRALRDGTAQLLEALRSFRPGDTAHARALARYWHGYAGELHAHHEVEDLIFFPRLAELAPIAERHQDQVAADHHRIDRLMEEISTAMTSLRRSASSADADAATRDVGALDALLADHLDLEDEDVLPLIARHVSVEEYDSMERAAVKHVGIGRQAAFTVPFLLEAATPEERAHMLSTAPSAFGVLYRFTRRSHHRLVERALGSGSSRQEVGR
jgi:hemerythrin-like domain-containing protein